MRTAANVGISGLYQPYLSYKIRFLTGTLLESLALIKALERISQR